MTRHSTASAARATSTAKPSHALAATRWSTKSAGSCRPGGRPTPTRTRWKSCVPSAFASERMPVVTGAATAELHHQLLGGDLDLVVDGHHVVGLDVVLARRSSRTAGPDSFMYRVDATSQTDLVTDLALGGLRRQEPRLAQPDAQTLRELVEHQTSGVVPRARVLVAGIAEAGDEPGHRGRLALGFGRGLGGRLGALGRPPPRGPLRPRAASAASSPGRSRSASVRSAAGRHDRDDRRGQVGQERRRRSAR